ncbi:hypothetical protein BGZ65_012996 [Modicella reniformis]|uniref:Protein kinase domain-containing protein n=1 Tax=Modicella reniformis TaxID=1440133 RepID=A0A9P6SPS9_9FUNG|nr:hypothetical protein BGZ65_012996 [Modicella reniformis]
MERVAPSGSLKRPSSVHTTSSIGPPSSPVGSLSTSLSLPDDSFSNNPEDYDIRQPVGYGSSAVVYNAYYKPLNKKVAIKVIDLDMFERNQIDELRRETQVMALCKHPNVLRVNGAFVKDSKLYIVTPYLSAGSCLDIMKTAYTDGLDEVSIATILKQALQGLDYLHKNGHIHRQVELHQQDVKAGNLLMDDDGSVLLADFGVSSSLMESGDRRGMRKTFVGTPCWMAPEVMEQAGYDYKADIWSFGITAIELATGHAPFARHPPIKVLMLTLSNDPPTLDRETTTHRYSKLFKEMIDSCLQKDPTKRPSTEKLLNHSFFKQAKKKSYLVTTLLQKLPPLEQRSFKISEKTLVIPEKGVSWDFDADEKSTGDHPAQESQGSEGPVRRPRTVTFEPSASRPVVITTTEPSPSISTAMAPALESRTIDSLPEDSVPSHSSTPLSTHGGDKPPKKSRFVVEDTPAVLSHVTPHMAETMSSSQVIGSPGQALTPIQTGQHLQSLSVSHAISDHAVSPEVRKGRFSVNNTSLSVASPVSSSVKTMPGEPLLSPSRSLSSSPVDGILDNVRINTSSEQALPPSERKSRFEVHHTTSTNGSGSNPPVLMGVQGTALPSESSQSRVPGDTGMTRENSAARICRLSVEPSTSHPESSSGTSSATAPSTGTPNPSNGASGTQSKRSRFQVSSVEGSKSVGEHLAAHGSGSLLCGQLALGTHSVYSHLETLYRQNEQQRHILTDLCAGFGQKTKLSSRGPSEGGTASHVVVGGTGLVHRQDQGLTQYSVERQLQVAVRENESLRRENEALKREIDRLRRGGH